MRERAVPCRGATLRESIDGTHKTFNDSAICDRCVVLAARAKASREERVRVPQVPSSASPPACSARVTERRTAGDAGTFDGFLSQPSGERDQAFPSRGTGPSRVGPLTTY